MSVSGSYLLLDSRSTEGDRDDEVVGFGIISTYSPSRTHFRRTSLRRRHSFQMVDDALGQRRTRGSAWSGILIVQSWPMFILIPG